MPLGERERRVLLGVGRQHLRLVAVGVRGGEVAVQRGRHVEVVDLVARRVAHDAYDARLRLAVAVRSQHDPRALSRAHQPLPPVSVARCASAGEPVCVQPGPLGHLGLRQGAAVDPAQQEVGERACGRRLVEDAGVPALDVGAQPARRGREPVAVEPERRREARRQLGRMEVPPLVVAARERAADQSQVVGPARRRTSSGVPTGSTLVEPSERRTPVPAAAACMTALAWSATGCSRLWWAAAMPQKAE